MMVDFFVSYNRADASWAEWVAWQLEDAGFTTVLQAWDFRPSSNFILEMDQSSRNASSTIAILSQSYLASGYCKAEWAAAFARDPAGIRQGLIPVLVGECDLSGVLGQIIYIDLRGIDEQQARDRLLEGVRPGRAKPGAAPGFPLKDKGVAPASPRFPGVLPQVWNVPYFRNLLFSGRIKLLDDIRAGLISGPWPAVWVVCGLGGVGKTQVVTEYAYRFSVDYSVVWWIRADNAETVLPDYIALAAELGMPCSNADDRKLVTGLVRRWLEQNSSWLLVFAIDM